MTPVADPCDSEGNCCDKKVKEPAERRRSLSYKNEKLGRWDAGGQSGVKGGKDFRRNWLIGNAAKGET